MLTEAVLLEHNRRLREENDELRETIRQMRESAAKDTELPADFPHLTPSERTIALALLNANGRAVPRGKIYHLLYGGEVEVEDKIIDVWMHRIRHRLEGYPYLIVTVKGRGWKIEEVEAQAA